MGNETKWEKFKKVPIDGEELYQRRARAALPLLVRQAHAGIPITYADLAQKLGMPKPLNLNYVLGCIGETLQYLGKKWKAKIPPLQCLVINKTTGLPGDGVAQFLAKDLDFASLPIRQKRIIVEAQLANIFVFTQWNNVLDSLGLTHPASNYDELLDLACRLGGGEGDGHKALKHYIAENPEAIGLNKALATGDIEFPLPSGDFLDISFNDQKNWIAVEAKSSISAESDILRGIFQCVKYLAVMEAVLISKETVKNSRVILALEGKFLDRLIPLKNLLRVEFVESVKIRK